MQPAADLALAIDLDGMADIFGEFQPELSLWAGSLAVILALLLAGALWSHVCRSPAERIVRKRFG